MGTSSRFEQVTALGRKLVDELGMESSTDTLGRWMAHYVAELMDAAENAPSEEREAARSRCFDAILKLWTHRAGLPEGKRPFEDLEPIVRALKSLDPENETPRYHRTIIGTIDESDEGRETQSLIELVCKIDTAARVLVGEILSDAACSAIDRSKAWVELAEDAGADSGVVSVVIEAVSGELSAEPSACEKKYDRLQDRIDRLEKFVEMVGPVLEDLKKRQQTN